ncbi:MAG: putative Ig domain-containing protein, partial [Deltaproteobacteria bacterium]|nr:putative Ig domain-containing protein [Candidatus Zymogenaceae bacterium]
TAANDAGSTTTQIGIVVYATAGATVTGTVILPMSVSDVSYVVVADTDHSGDNGGQAAWAIGTVTGSSFVYTMENVPAGTYNFYAIIYVSGSMMMGAPSEDELTTSDSTFVDISGTGSYVVNRVCYSRLPPADNADYFWYPSFSRSLVLGTPVSDFTPTFPFDWEITSYSIDTDSWGALPAGLTLDGATGAITGTPTEAWDSTLYVIDVEYEHGTALTAIRLNVSPTTGATINGTVTLPVSVTGKPYLVVVDTDDDMTNGGYASVAAGSVTGSSFEYWIENVPDGDFVVYAAVFDVSDIWLLSDISPGDYLSDEGTLVTVDGPDTYMADRSCSLIE